MAKKTPTFILFVFEGVAAPAREMGRFATEDEAKKTGDHLIATIGCPVVRYEIKTAD
jgi:hypothetical protein